MSSVVFLCSSELQLIKLRVHSAFSHQTFVVTLLNYLTVSNDRDSVGVLNGGKSVRHNDGGSSAAKLVQRLLNKYLSGVVKS